MAFLGGTFDANNVEPSAPIELLPPGDYPVQIVASEMKDTKTGGQMLALTLEITDGPARGRKLWENLNLVNSNTQAVEIAQRTLSAICHAVGRLQVNDSEELHFKPMIASVATLPPGHTEKNGYVHKNGKNEVKGFKAYGGGMPASAPQMAAQPAQRPAAMTPAARPATATNAPPWRRTA